MACEHERTLMISSKVSDTLYLDIGERGPGKAPELTHQGYVPRDLGLGGTDYLELEVCLACKVVLDLADADKIRAAIIALRR